MGVGSPVLGPRRDPAGGPPLLGRERELERLREMLAEAASGRPQLVLIQGRVGVGKTRLAAAAAELARAGGFDVRFVDGRSCGRDDFSGIAAVDGSTGDEATAVGTPGDQVVRYGDRVADLAARRPTAIVIDDVDHLDPRSVDVLHYLARWAASSVLNRGTRLAIIGSMESDALADLPLRALERQGMARVLRVDNLGELEALALVRALAGPTSQLVAESVATAAEGNPLTIRAVTDRLIAEGRLGPGALQTPVSAPIRKWQLSHSPSEAIEHQYEGLPTSALQFLAAIAVAGEEAELADIAQLVGVGTDEVTAAMDAGAAVGLLDARSFGFAHPLARERALGEVTPAELERLHLARALQIVDGRGPRSRLVEHLTAAGPSADRAFVYDQATALADEMENQGQWLAASRCAQLALVASRGLNGIDRARVASLTYRGARSLWLAGDIESARQWATRAIDVGLGGLGGEVESQARILQLRCSVWLGSFGDRVDTRPALAVASDVDERPDLRAEAQLTVSEAAWMAGDADDAIRQAAAASELASGAPDSDLSARARVSTATAHWLRLELVEARRELELAAREAVHAPETGALAVAEGRLALTHWWLGESEAAEQSIAVALRAARAAGTPLERAIPLAATTAIAALKGRHDTAMTAAAQAELMSDVSGDSWAEALVYPAAAANAAWHGDLNDADQIVGRWLASIGRRATTNRLVEITIDAHRYYVAALAGDQAAIAALTRLAPPSEPAHRIKPIIGGASFFGLLADVGLRANDQDLVGKCATYLRVAYDRGERVTSGWPQLLARLLAGATRLAGDLEGAMAQASEALDHAESSGLLVEQVRARLELARVEAALGHSAKADDQRTAAATRVADHRLAGLEPELEAPLRAASDP